MTRRIEAGPVLVGLGALLLLVSLFLDWYEPNVTAWEAFEVLDLVLTVLAIGAILAAAGAMRPDAGVVVERHWLPAIAAASLIVVVSQILEPPPLIDGDPALGAWLALGAVLAIALGTLLTLGRVSLALTVEGRDTRRRVSAVDARTDPTTSEGPAVTAPPEGPTGTTRVMGNDKT